MVPLICFTNYLCFIQLDRISCLWFCFLFCTQSYSLDQLYCYPNSLLQDKLLFSVCRCKCILKALSSVEGREPCCDELPTALGFLKVRKQHCLNLFSITQIFWIFSIKVHSKIRQIAFIFPPWNLWIIQTSFWKKGSEQQTVNISTVQTMCELSTWV